MYMSVICDSKVLIILNIILKLVLSAYVYDLINMGLLRKNAFDNKYFKKYIRAFKKSFHQL